ncbi:DUF1194 domain-containing protein [uncultured Alsobacter sp.]|uniref:DUF1194 domain-containing protein n=1 Tax=uncultured Alsobacter sp. TaxID=1748258 RepID=UPI0025EA1081|nr:DUF1194 domain-containing protein [uncultured Alsobacter sp.]
MNDRGITRRDLLAGAAGACALGSEASAQSDGQREVDLHLVLAVDASGSVNQTRFELQRAGYAAAFRDKDVQMAIRGGALGRIAVTMVQWTGPRLHVVVVPWVMVDGPAGADALAAAIDKAPRQLFGGGTSVSGAIDFSATLFPQSPFQGGRRVIDVSGDGRNASGRPATVARDAAVAQGIVINGLPILAVEWDLAEHYRDEVIGGPGSFMIPAKDFNDFADAVRRKLILEISGLPGSVKVGDNRG